MGPVKKMLITLCIGILLLPVLGAWQSAAADDMNWYNGLSDFEVRAYNDIGLVGEVITEEVGERDDMLVVTPNTGVVPGVSRRGEFYIGNMSPGDLKTSTIKISNECDSSFSLKVEAFCLDDFSADETSGKILNFGKDGNGNDVILARQLKIRTYLLDSATMKKITDKQDEIRAYLTANGLFMPAATTAKLIDDDLRKRYNSAFLPNGSPLKAMMLELESYFPAAIPDFPKNYELKVGDELPRKKDNSTTPPTIVYDGNKIGEYDIPGDMKPGSVCYLMIDVELPGAETGNEYQDRSALFRWVLTACILPPGPGEGGGKDTGSDTDRWYDRDRPPGGGGGGTTITDPNPPTGGGNIPEPPEINIPDPGVPGGPYMPKTGEAPLWYSLLPGLMLILLGVMLLVRRKEDYPEAE